MNTPTAYECLLICRSLHAYASDVKTEAKKVAALGFEAEASNLRAAADTITEHILPMFGEAPAPKNGKPAPGTGPQITLEEAIAEAEAAMRQPPAPTEPPLLPPGLEFAPDEPSGTVEVYECMHCGKPIPEGEGFEFCSEACRKAFIAAAQQEGVVVDDDPGPPDSDWTVGVCKHGVPMVQPCEECRAGR